MIELQRVTAGYAGIRILEDFSLSVESGASLCLYGASGIGKSTILRIASGLMKPWSGKVVNDFHRVGYVFQDDRLLPWLSAKENILFGLSGKGSRWEGEKIAEKWLERFELEDAADKLPGELSGGMRRRVNLARALAYGPECLLLDEAFTFLDERMVQRSLEAVLEWRSASHGTILAVSHDLTVTAPLKMRVLRLSGRPLHVVQ